MSFNEQRNALGSSSGPALPSGWEAQPGGAFAPAPMTMPVPFPGPAGAVPYPAGARDMRPDMLQPGQRLIQGQMISARNGSVYLTFQTDGNLVLYRRRDNYPLWSSRTENRGASECIMEDNGNFVVYDLRRTPLWTSNTHGNFGANLLVQDDGNLCVNHGNQCKWASNTYGQN